MVVGNTSGGGDPDGPAGRDGRVCPVCGGHGTRQGLRNHLQFDHGWATDRIETAVPTVPE